MHWATGQFQELYDALGGSAAEGKLVDGVLDSAKSLSEDLRAILAAPPKSDASRSQLAKRVLKLEDGLEYQLSTDFANSAAELSDAINLDEIAAANLILASASSPSRLSVSHCTAALVMFHIRRQYILNTLLYICEQLPLCDPSSLLFEQLSELLGICFVEKPGQAILDSLKTVEQNLRELNEKSMREKILGLGLDPKTQEEAQIQRSFLLEQHQTLGCLFYALIRLGRIDAGTALQATKHALTLETYDTLLLAYAAPLSLFFSLFDEITTPAVKTITQSALTKTDASIFEDFFAQPDTECRLPWWRGSLAVLFLTFRLGKVAESDEDERNRILNVMRQSIDEGALEGLMSFAWDMSERPATPMFANYKNLMRTRVLDLVAEDKQGLDKLAERFKPVLELYFEATVTNAADLLQEMRLNEEDSFLALASESSSSTSETIEILPGRDLERFFLFVSYLFADQPAAAEIVWADHDGSMYGFLVWAAQCQSALMPAAFAEMLASLSSTPATAKQAFEFLSDANSDATDQSGEFLSWRSILERLVFYRRSLDPKSTRSLLNDTTTSTNDPQSTPSNSQQARRTNAELDDYNIFRIFGLLRLISSIAQNCQAARQQCFKLDTDLKLCIIGVLVDYLRIKNPFYGPIFWTLSCFAGLKDSDGAITNNQIWSYIDDLAYKKEIKTLDGTSIHSFGVDRFHKVLNYVADAVSLLRLIRKLMEGLKPSSKNLPEHLSEFATFGIQCAFTLDKNIERMGSENAHKLLYEGLLLLNLLVDPLDGTVESLRQTGVLQDVLHQDPLLAGFLQQYPQHMGLELSHSRPVSTTLLQLLSTDLEVIDANLVTSNIVQNVLLAGRIVISLLKSQRTTHNSGLEFDKIVLGHIEAVPKLLLYTGSNHYSVVVMSIELLDLVDKSSAFAPGPSHKSRMVSVMDSMLDADRVRLGLVWQLSSASEQNDALSMQLQHKVRLAILGLVLSSLERNAQRQRPCLAHTLLGFTSSGGSSILANPSSPCGVGSESSLLDTICNLLIANLEEMSSTLITERTASLVSVCSEILASLLRHQSSSRPTLELLRENELLHRVLQVEPIVSLQTIWECDQRQATGADADVSTTLVSFFTHRAALIEMISYDMHVLLNDKSYSQLSQYIDELLDSQKRNGKSLLSMLDFLKFDFSQLHPASSGSSSSAVDWPAQPLRAAEKLLTLPGNHTKELTILMKLQNTDQTGLLALYARDKANAAIKAAQLRCLQAWCGLVSVVVSDVPNSLNILPASFVSETIEALIPKLTQYSRPDIAFREPVASLLVLLLERQETSSLLQDYATSKRLIWLYEASVTSVQAALALPDLRADLYTICYKTLLMCLNCNGQEPKQMLNLVLSGSEYLLQTVLQDSTRGDLRLRLSALIFLRALLQSERKCNGSVLEERLLHGDMPRRLIESMRVLNSSTSSSTSSNSGGTSGGSTSSNSTVIQKKELSNETIRLALAILLHLAQSRQGANLVLQSGIIHYIEETGLLAADAEEILRTNLPLMIFQLLAAIAVTLGNADYNNLQQLRQFMSLCQPLVAKVLKADAFNAKIANTQPASMLADVIVLLFDLTGLSPRV